MLQLSRNDVESLLRLWPGAAACPTWRLDGSSPSISLLNEIQRGVDREKMVRDDRGRAAGLLQARDVDHASGSCFLSFLLSPSAVVSSPVLPFLAASIRALDLRKIIVPVDRDMLHAIGDARGELVQVGELRQHALIGRARFTDRCIFEYTGTAGPM